MAGGTVTSWDEVWTIGRDAGCTHWNYSRGKIRFRGIIEEPEEIGEEIILSDGEKIRIRFYTLVGDEYVENEEHDTWFKPPKESPALDVPDDFEGWDEDKQHKYIQITMQRISAGRYARQMDSADKMFFRFIDHLTKTIDKKDKLIAELYAKVNELMASKGIANIWEFLVHPNANQIVATIMSSLGSGKATPSEVVEEIKRLNGVVETAKPR